MHHSRLIPLIIAALAPAAAFPATSINENFHFGITTASPRLTFDILDEGQDAITNSGNSLGYEPKIPIVLGGELTLFGVSVGVDKTFTPNTGNEELTYSDYSASTYRSFWGAEVNRTEFKGFRLASAGGGLNIDDLPQQEVFRGDLTIQVTNVNLYAFPLRVKWNLEQAFNAGIANHTTGFGIGAALTYNTLSIDAQNGIIPPVFEPSFNDDGATTRGFFKTATVGPAAGATLAIGHFYLSGFGAFTFGRQWIDYHLNNGADINRIGSTTNKTFRAMAGYRIQRVFLTFKAIHDSPTFPLYSIAINGKRTALNLELGMNF